VEKLEAANNLEISILAAPDQDLNGSDPSPANPTNLGINENESERFPEITIH